MSPRDDMNRPSKENILRRKIKQAQSVTPNLNHIKTAMGALDLTSLTGEESEEDIIALCQKAKEDNVAAVCVYPQYVAQVADLLDATEIQIAAVINFPLGSHTNNGDVATYDNTYDAVKDAIENGATEIDIVVDYKHYMDGNNARDLLRACRKACDEGCATMKTILETGAFGLDDDIKYLSALAIEEETDFIKTSTGKYVDPEFPNDNGGATPEAVLAMLSVIQKFKIEGRNVGLKISGGVNDRNFASFIEIVKSDMGDDFLSNDTFRIGASGLYNYLKLSLDTNGIVSPHVHKRVPLGY